MADSYQRRIKGTSVEKMKLLAFDQEKIKATRAAWILACGDDAILKGEYSSRLDRAFGFTEYTNAEQMTYGVFEEKSSKAVAYVSVNATRTGKRWTKMLDMHLAPDIDLAVEKNEPDFELLAAIFLGATVGVVELTHEHRSTTIKLYARTTVLLKFFFRSWHSICRRSKKTLALRSRT